MQPEKSGVQKSLNTNEDFLNNSFDLTFKTHETMLKPTSRGIVQKVFKKSTTHRRKLEHHWVYYPL